ncbi:hypothetical protein [Solidesulfovibrio alcoholivorans]|uniref:hypothetical protein n=1 Tax=Solidesulfovibrio alcoholivorans TaxID=81406 RepID=UPI00049697BB|nr:hypothetical protein [Solidesulfovibrio alcoholivorans]
MRFRDRIFCGTKPDTGLAACDNAQYPCYHSLRFFTELRMQRIHAAALTFAIFTVLPLLLLVLIGLAHVAANTPNEADFDALPTRDAQTYFADMKGQPVTVQYDFLRDGPTQAGIGFPGYYL